MAKKNKLATPTWILEGFDSEADYNKANGKKVVTPQGCIPKEGTRTSYEAPKNSTRGKKKCKIFKIRKCPACASKNVSVVLGEVGMWKCNDCSFRGTEIIEEEVSEEEFMKYLDEKGEEVA